MEPCRSRASRIRPRVPIGHPALAVETIADDAPEELFGAPMRFVGRCPRHLFHPALFDRGSRDDSRRADLFLFSWMSFHFGPG